MRDSVPGNPYAAPTTPVDSASPRSRRLMGRDWRVVPVAAFGALPSILLASIYTFAFRASLHLGHWPYYGHPDPKDLPDGFHPQSAPLAFLVPITVYLAWTWFLVFLVDRFAPASWRVPSALALAALSWSLCIGIARLDPGGVINWIAD